MPLRKSNYMLLILLMLASIGQSWAVVSVPCSMATQGLNPNAMQGMTNMDHSAHANMNKNTDGTAENCCEQSSSCPMTTCITAMALLVGTSSVEPQMPSDKIDLYRFALLTPITTALYRPPISS